LLLACQKLPQGGHFPADFLIISHRLTQLPAEGTLEMAFDGKDHVGSLCRLFNAVPAPENTHSTPFALFLAAAGNMALSWCIPLWS
jgi:hypothetical protein